MKAFVASLYIEKGTDWSRTFRFYSDAAKTQPIDFSGCTGRCTIVDLDGLTVASPTVTFGTGSITLALTHAQSSAIPTEGIGYDKLTEYYFDTEVTDASGKVTRWINGPAEISPEVTQ